MKLGPLAGDPKRENSRGCRDLGVELGGLEPPTSWVRSTEAPAELGAKCLNRAPTPAEFTGEQWTASNKPFPLRGLATLSYL